MSDRARRIAIPLAAFMFGLVALGVVAVFDIDVRADVTSPPPPWAAPLFRADRPIPPRGGEGPRVHA